MTIWTKAIAAVVGTALLLPTAAMAADYPQVLEISGKECIKDLDSRGAVGIWCLKFGDYVRITEAEYVRMTQTDHGSKEAPPTLRLEIPRSAQDSFVVPASYSNHVFAAQGMASADSGATRYFFGGLALGILGPVGWLTGGLVANSSNVELPIVPPSWTDSDQAQFALTYATEVRSKRTTSAVIGGIVGTVVTGLVIYAIAK
ncbi:hypothetical protein [Vulgatibacter incomptus]|uniref:Uncharacterized protein n=1 Tax=Vulgatibacter incomptus TaxID=1391653 RepID=A0A0K1P9C0_9BACT|nr:hypothetical protein [Vulgatibacter incomptus]AKU89699.1 hypothetical protein AKJ08_0086 [Vulgatibacter incomptus]